MTEPWRHLAACAGHNTNYWFPHQKRNHTPITPAARKAIQICQTCPVQQQCLTHSLKQPETHGIWGGLTFEQRRDLKTNGKKPIITHGTSSGYEQHLRHGQPACHQCKRAHADYTAARRRIRQREQTRNQLEEGDTA